MVFCRVCREAHQYGTTLYVAGVLHDTAADLILEHVSMLPGETTVVRLDIRAVVLIDPHAFVRVARTLNTWRDHERNRRLRIEFPDRSRTAPRVPRHPLALHVVDQTRTTPSAVSTAII
jgi:hypothetical protein